MHVCCISFNHPIKELIDNTTWWQDSDRLLFKNWKYEKLFFQIMATFQISPSSTSILLNRTNCLNGFIGLNDSKNRQDSKEKSKKTK